MCIRDSNSTTSAAEQPCIQRPLPLRLIAVLVIARRRGALVRLGMPTLLVEKACRAQRNKTRAMSDFDRLFGLAGMLRVDRIESSALADNPLGDAAVRTLAVYTPPGYDAEGSKRYPVLYCLHGYTGDVGALVATRPWETNVVQWIDRLIGSGAMAPAILAIVDGNTRLGGSQYLDSIHNGAYLCTSFATSSVTSMRITEPSR